MIMGFCLIIYGGPLALMFTVNSFNSNSAIVVACHRQMSFRLISDTSGASEMLRRDYFDWLSSVSHPRFAMVPKPFVVFLDNIQLLFLRWKLSGLLQCAGESCWNPSILGHLSSFPIVHTVLHWFRVVCVVASQKILHEAIQFVCMDSCRPVDCRDTELFNHSEHFRR